MRRARWLEQRPPTGIWGGLWVCPQFDNEAALHEWVGANLRPAAPPRLLPVIDHAFTHFDLRLRPALLQDVAFVDAVAEARPGCWYDPQQPARIGLAKPVFDILKLLPQLDAKT
jgi:A/G-specific adenine glycosylase